MQFQKAFNPHNNKAMENQRLTTDNRPKVLHNILLKEGQFRFTNDALIEGRSIIINKTGKQFIYMADDKRDDSTLIIAHDFAGNLCFLSSDCKKSITLI